MHTLAGVVLDLATVVLAIVAVGLALAGANDLLAGDQFKSDNAIGETANLLRDVRGTLLVLAACGLVIVAGLLQLRGLLYRLADTARSS